MASYQDIFRKYMEFNPFFRRKLIKIKDIHRYIEKLMINKYLKNEREVKIFLEYLYQENIVIPFFKVEFPVEHKFHTHWSF